MTSPNSNNSPSPEERKRIVAAAMKMIRADDMPKPPTELEQLAGARNLVRSKVMDKLRPIVETAKMAAITSPFYIHSEAGRMALFETAVKLYVDELRKFNREEALFLLACTYGELTLADFV